MFFSDAVFAIAMTLLALDLRVVFPEDASSAQISEVLIEKIPAFAGFVLSFMLVGSTWITHHRRFSGIASYDSRLQWINLILLIQVVFMPVPTSMLFEQSGRSPWPVVIYALVIAGIYLSLAWLWSYARKAGLMTAEVSGPLYRYTLYSTLPVWLVFLLSIPVAFVSSAAAMLCWILISPVSLIHGSWSRKRFEAAETARFQVEDAAAADR